MGASDKTEWWRGATLYQIYPLSFADSNGDGWGDLPGITSKLDHVASLGVDGIWLSPFFRSAWVDYGYDTIDQCAVDPRCGTLADFDRLLQRAHDLGLKVVIDQVYTYTSKDHPWFIESRMAPHGPRGDWYEWDDAKADGSPPSNWISIFGGSAWHWDIERRQYYMSHFLPEMPHLRVQKPEVQNALLDIGRFWLDRGVDGFRLDVINLAAVDPLHRDNPASGISKPRLPIEAQRGIHDQSRPESLAFVRRIRAMTDAYPGRFLMGEIGGWDRMRTTQTYTVGKSLLDSAYFVLAESKGTLNASVLRKELEAWSAADLGWPTWSFSNHDLVRGPSRCSTGSVDDRLARMLVALLIAARGTALLYMGDELGLPDGEVPFDLLRDPASRRFHPHFLQRDGARTPMPWRHDLPAVGFSSGKPWLPIGPTHSKLAVDRQEQDPESTLAWTKRLVRLRREHIVLRLGDICFIDHDDALLVFDRRRDDAMVRCVFNPSDQSRRMSGVFQGTPRILAGSGLEGESGGEVLGPWGFCIFESR